MTTQTSPHGESVDYTDVMRRAVMLSLNGPAHDANPRVGCVILDAHGHVIGEGWHRGAGTPHAEIEALAELSPEQTLGSTVVVSLEPCNHRGRTGPCVDALINAGVSRVVFGLTDPGAIQGGGAERLGQAGIEVIGGVAADDVMAVVAEWYFSAQNGRPFVTVKWGSSLDGRAAANDGSSQWITGAESRDRVHLQRSEHAAIAVGTSTVLADNPSLTARMPDGSLYSHQPIPVVIGVREVHGELLAEHPQKTVFVRTRNLHDVLDELRQRGIHSLYVEGGPTLASAFIGAGLVDRFYIYFSPTLLGGSRLAVTDLGVKTLAERIDLDIEGLERLGDDILITAHPQQLSTVLPMASAQSKRSDS